MLGGAPVLRVDVPRPPFLDAVQAAADDGRRLAITYFVANRGERAERVVDPVAVVGDRGHWYLQALDHGGRRERWFRVDRIEALVETGEPTTGDLPPAAKPRTGWPVRRRRGRAAARQPDGAWMTERYPVISGTPDGPEHLVVELPVLSVRWLERLLLRLGAAAEVLDPPELRGPGRDRGRRVLARYR